MNDIAWLGYTRLLLRSDIEPAMLALISDALRGLRVQLLDIETVAAEGSVPYDPQTNGAAEAAVKLVRSIDFGTTSADTDSSKSSDIDMVDQTRCYPENDSSSWTRRENCL